LALDASKMNDRARSSEAYAGVLAWLYRTQMFGIKLGLDNMRRLLELIGLPGKAQRIIHVAGTNGKGSTCAMIDVLSRAGRHRTGLFTSPHLVSFTERIRVDGAPIPEAEATWRLEKIREKIAAWEPHPTFFEIVTVLGLWWFRDAGAQVIVLETGMGGRLDATNATTPAVSVITPIGLDHMQWLGGTLEAIAAEKAGIIKPGVPVVSAPQEPEALAVLVRVAEENGSSFVMVDAPWSGPVSLVGFHQRWNAALALVGMKAAGLATPADALAHVEWPGRFQRLGEHGRLVLDGAHNPHGARALVATWHEVFRHEKAQIIFGAVAPKDHEGIIAELQRIADRFVFTTIDSPRAVPGALLAQAVPGSIVAPTVRDAIDMVDRSPPAPPVLICGSLFLVGEALALLTPGRAFERSAQ
jgi:dihydrofolate synthase/folylpolyglutamate synthase